MLTCSRHQRPKWFPCIAAKPLNTRCCVAATLSIPKSPVATASRSGGGTHLTLSDVHRDSPKLKFSVRKMSLPRTTHPQVLLCYQLVV